MEDGRHGGGGGAISAMTVIEAATMIKAAALVPDSKEAATATTASEAAACIDVDRESHLDFGFTSDFFHFPPRGVHRGLKSSYAQA